MARPRGASPEPAGCRYAGALSPDGTDVAFADVRAQTVRVTLDDVSGSFCGLALASLAEVEVIVKGDAIAAPEPGGGAAGLAALGLLLAGWRRSPDR